MQQQDLIYRKQYMQQLQSLKDQNIIKVDFRSAALWEVNIADDVR